MTQKVMLVDDDPNLLSALTRHYRNWFDLLTANNPDEALEIVNGDQAVAVAVVDMRMPGMDGIQLLQEIRKISPNTVRIMLTGNADQQTSVDAINQGRIFRFFSKPCEPDTLANGIDAGIEQYNLVTAEQELLEHTLAGSVKALIDVLSIVHPVSFGRSDKIRDWAEKLARKMELKQPWRLSMATMLSQLGNITIPPDILAKLSKRSALSDAEQEIVDRAPEVARDLIANIPRLKAISEVVYLQNKGFNGSGFPEDGPSGTDIPLNARILKILVDLEAQTDGAYPTPEAFETLINHSGAYDTVLLSDMRQCLETEKSSDEDLGPEEMELPARLLLYGDTLISDLKLENDSLFLSAEIRLSTIHVHQFKAFSRIHKFKEPVKVLRPRDTLD